MLSGGRNRTRHLQKIHARCRQHPRLRAFVNQNTQRRYRVGFLSPMADLKVFEAVNSSSTGVSGSGSFCLRVVRLLVSPNGRLLRRVLVVLVVIPVIVGSDRSRRSAQIDPVLCTHLRSAIRLKAVACAAHTQTLLSTQLPSDKMFFSLFFHISGQDIFPLSRIAFSDQSRTAPWSPTCILVMRHTRPFLNVLRTRPISSDGSCIGP